MAGLHGLWRTEPNGGALAAEVGGLRLVVLRPEEAGGAVRFLVSRRSGEGQAMLGSGTEADVRAAMGAAVRMAERIAALSFQGLDQTRGLDRTQT